MPFPHRTLIPSAFPLFLALTVPLVPQAPPIQMFGKNIRNTWMRIAHHATLLPVCQKTMCQNK